MKISIIQLILLFILGLIIGFSLSNLMKTKKENFCNHAGCTCKMSNGRIGHIQKNGSGCK